MTELRIALIQQAATPDLAANLEKGLYAARRAAADGAKVVCFAELAFTPFYPQAPSSGNLAELAQEIPGPITEVFSELARELEIVVIPNLFERDGDRTYDSSPLIDAGGELLGVTRMVHITDYPCFHEQDYYHPSELGAPVYQTAAGKLGVAICYDRHYPEYMRALALAGAEVVFIPQAGAIDEWPEGLFEAELRVASFQNGYYTALCNRVGAEASLTFAGGSFVCDPAGRVIARAGEGTEETLSCDLELDEVERSHARELFLRDRRPELYPAWLGRR